MTNTLVEHYETNSHNSSLHVTMYTNVLYYKGSAFWPTKISRKTSLNIYIFWVCVYIYIHTQLYIYQAKQMALHQ